jgi:2,4'-dihydroxyacetophenone dioxygenase
VTADTWRVVGNGPCTVFIATRGAMEYLDDDGHVIRRDTTETMRDTYERFCEDEGIGIADLEG